MIMPSKDRDGPRGSPGGGSDDSEADDSRDYLQDPELWVDRLPQPFRAIDELLQELVGGAWAAIEERQVARGLEEARVRIPEVSGARLVTGVEVGSKASLVLFLVTLCISILTHTHD